MTTNNTEPPSQNPDNTVTIVVIETTEYRLDVDADLYHDPDRHNELDQVIADATSHNDGFYAVHSREVSLCDDDDSDEYDDSSEYDTDNTDDVVDSTDQHQPRYPHITVQLSAMNGNAFVIVSRVRSELKRHGVSRHEQEQFFNEALSGNYHHVLATCDRWVQVV